MRGHWRAHRVSWDACLPTAPEGPHPRRLISFDVRDATRTGNVLASRRRRGWRNRAPTKKDVGEGEDLRGSWPGRAILVMLRETQYLLTVCARPPGVGLQNGRTISPRRCRTPRVRRVATHHVRSLGADRDDPRAVLCESLLSTRPRNGTRQT